MTRRYLTIFFLGLLGCKEITFKAPQPEGRKALTQVPKGLQGKYVITNEDTENTDNDTIIISANGYRMVYANPDEQFLRGGFDEAFLSDSLVLKASKGYYFVNAGKNDNWLLRILKQDRDGGFQLMTPGDPNQDFAGYLQRLSNEIVIDSTSVDGEVRYQITPTEKELISLIERGFFSSVRLQKIR